MASWRTVSDSKVVWAPIGFRTKKDGTAAPKFSRIGIKIEMIDGSWWFYSFKHESWTRHDKPIRALDRLGRPAVEAGKPVFLPARKNRWDSWNDIVKDYQQRSPGIISVLQEAAAMALESEN